MNLPGPPSISSINAPVNREAGLHPFQRVTAQILAVTGTTAVLSIEGHVIVAQLASGEQATALLTQPTAQFIVTQVSDQQVTLKIVQEDQSPASSPGSVFNGVDLATRLLDQHNIPATVNNLMIARSVLGKQLPVTSKLLNELKGALSAYGPWGATEAELAAALKAAGLPVNAQSLALASRKPGKIGDSIARLIALLTGVAGQDLSADLLKQLNMNLQVLDTMVLDGDEETSKMAEQLKAAVETLGASLESILLEQSQNPKGASAEKGLLLLIRLQQMLEQVGKGELAEAIGEFLADIRLNQFLNVRPDPIPRGGEWSEIDFVIQGAQQKADEEFSSARLRIAREPRSTAGNPDPASKRWILQVDISPEETIEVDLAVIGKQIRTSVTAPNPAWCQQAEHELPSLEQALQGLGFVLKDAQICLGEPKPFDRLNLVSGNTPLTTVDIEV